MTVDSCQLCTCAVRTKVSPLMMHLELAGEQQFPFMITLNTAELIFFLYWNENKTFQALCQNVFEWKKCIFGSKPHHIYVCVLFLFSSNLRNLLLSPKSTWSLFHKACQPQQRILVWQESSGKEFSRHSHGFIPCKDITIREQRIDKRKVLPKQKIGFNQILS